MPWVHQLSRVSIKRQGLLSWTVALALFTVSIAIRILFDPFLAGMKFITFWPAIIVATLICGWRQGIFVLLLCQELENGWRIRAKSGLVVLLRKDDQLIVSGRSSHAVRKALGLTKLNFETE